MRRRKQKILNRFHTPDYTARVKAHFGRVYSGKCEACTFQTAIYTDKHTAERHVLAHRALALRVQQESWDLQWPKQWLMLSTLVKP